jgi:hypothetical protein
MTWPFRKRAEPEPEYRTPALEVFEREYKPAPTPPDLLEAAERGRNGWTEEWTREKYAARRREMGEVPLAPPAPPTVGWTRDLPTVPGVYWHAPAVDVSELHLLVVLRFGQQLCVREHRGGTIKFVGIQRIGGYWSVSPVAIPEFARLEEISV